MLTLESLDQLLTKVTYEAAEKRSKQLHNPHAVAADYASRLQDRAVFRRLLSDNALDGERFRWWFAQPHNRTAYDLDGWRQRIDAQMIKEQESKRNG